jgi:hypothetical protein
MRGWKIAECGNDAALKNGLADKSPAAARFPKYLVQKMDAPVFCAAIFFESRMHQCRMLTTRLLVMPAAFSRKV